MHKACSAVTEDKVCFEQLYFSLILVEQCVCVVRAGMHVCVCVCVILWEFRVPM